MKHNKYDISITVIIYLEYYIRLVSNVLCSRYLAIEFEEDEDRKVKDVLLDYMLHHDYQLGVHDHILECCRKKTKIELELVRLSPADQMDLGPILSMNTSDELDVEIKKLQETDDCWNEDNLSRKSELKHLHTNKECIFKGDVKWPFRVLVRGIEDCPGEEQKLKSVFLEIGLYYCGQPLGPTESGNKGTPNSQNLPPMRSTTVPFGSNPSFPGTWLSSTRHEMAVLPPTTRVGFLLFGEVEITHEIVPVAGVSLTLVDYNNALLTGKMALKMWPHEKLQIARKPEVSERSGGGVDEDGNASHY